MATAGKKPNRLALEKSPYLLQHATNPVDWYEIVYLKSFAFLGNNLYLIILV